MHSRHSQQLHQALAVLAPPRRFELLLLLLTGVDRSVSQLASAVRLSQSCTTRHLQALARAGLVKGVRDGKRVVFRLAPRDAVAAGVLASLAGARPIAPVRRAAVARPARALAPRPAPGPAPWPAPAPQAAVLSEGAAYSDSPYASDDGGSPQAIPESGNKSSLTGSTPRFRQELEDYLL